jgi:magnesium chelatase subunit D
VRKDNRVLPLLVLVSDGRANVNLYGGDPVEEAKVIAREIGSGGIQSIAIDTERSFLSFGLVRQICEEMCGKYLRLEELSAEPLVSAVRENMFHGPEMTWCNS